jgi:hypothetical protein
VVGVWEYMVRLCFGYGIDLGMLEEEAKGRNEECRELFLFFCIELARLANCHYLTFCSIRGSS